MVRHEQQRLFAAGMAAIVGVDAGKFAHALAVQRSDGTRAPPILVPTTRTGFEAGLVSLQQLISAPADRVLIAIEFAGYFGFTLAHFLHAHGYPIVSVLPAHTKRFKDVVHGQPLKSDPKDAETVAELARQGFYVAFPFLAPPYARLRYLVSGRERLSLQRRSLINRIRSLLQVVWPEFEQIFPQLTKRTPFEVLARSRGRRPCSPLTGPRWRRSCGTRAGATMATPRCSSCAPRPSTPWGCLVPKRRLPSSSNSCWNSIVSISGRSGDWRRRWWRRSAHSPKRTASRPSRSWRR